MGEWRGEMSEVSKGGMRGGELDERRERKRGRKVGRGTEEYEKG